jgi:hypothetical protein
MSRRDNGLSAASYTPLADVESPVVDGLLERLRDEEVAAYVAPAPGQRGPYGDTVLPRAPSETVFVDSDRREHARGVVDRYLAEVREEIAWAGIVAGFDQAGDPVGSWPAAEDVPPDPDDDPAARPGRLLRPAGATIGFEELRDVAEPTPRPDPDDHFEPPLPPPVTLPDTVSRLAWAGFLGGPLFLLLATAADLDIAGWPGLLGLGAFMAGFVTLVARMPDRSPDDLGGDDGAVV